MKWLWIKEDVTENSTYQKAKVYIKEKYELNVYTKYIAKAKHKHGSSMHEAQKKADVPNIEYWKKVKTIEGALKYFIMIE